MENVSEILPLSPVQEGMLFECINEQSATGIYVAVITVTLHGTIDPNRFKSAIETNIHACDAVRAAFIWEGVSQPVQLIRNTIDLPFTYLDWTSSNSFGSELESLILRERTQGFDLKVAPLMRATLIRQGENSHKFVWTVHHLIGDGWSTGVLLNNILAQYNGMPKPQSETSASFRRYLSWLKSRDTAPDVPFWSEYLRGVNTTSTLAAAKPVLPTDPMPRVITAQIPPELVTKLKETARTQRITPATLLSTVWSLVLRRYSGSNDVVFGQTSSGRPSAITGIENAVGAFINTLPVRVKINPNTPASALLIDSEADAIKRRPYEHSSLRDVIDCTELPRGRQLFDSIFVFEDFPLTTTKSDGIYVADINWLNTSPNSLALLVRPGVIWKLEAVFDPTKLSEQQVGQILDDYLSLLENLSAHPSLSISELTRQSWSPLTSNISASSEFLSVVAHILQHSEIAPDIKAIVDREKHLSYRDLAETSQRLAARLQAEGIGKGDIVPIALNRSSDVIVAMIAIMRTGACYTPLDLDYPAERLRQILEACNPRVIVTSKDAVPKLPTFEAIILDMHTTAGPVSFVAPAINETDLAYIIFTSGSTGKPKGVMISHGNLAYSTHARDSIYPNAPDAFLLLSSFAFDSSAVGIYWTLTKGGKLVIAKSRAEQYMETLGNTIRDERISHILCLPSLYHSLIESVPTDRLTSLNTAIVAGEAVMASTLNTHRTKLPAVKLFNEYGPTEATIWCAACDLTNVDPSAPIPIGSAPQGTSLTITDLDGAPLPDGIIGEITTCGPGTAQGYLNAPEASQAAFWDRTYKTGDLGYALPGGQFVCLGRKDAQVKIRGHRIELADVEANIIAATGLSEAAVIIDNSGTAPQLSAFFVADHDSFEPSQIKAKIAQALPSHMVPNTLTALAALPRLPNGKTDTNALSQLERPPQTPSTDRRPTATFTETQLAGVWKEVLGVQNVYRDDDFFDLGGDSLKTISTALKAEEIGLNIAPYELFEHPKLRDLAQQLHMRAEALAQTKPDANLAHANDDGEKPIFFMIHGSLKMYSYLSETLGRDRPLGFLFSHFFGGDILPHERIETLTDDAMKHLKSLKANGPYHVGGYSLGGIIALELANRLREAGETVETLFLLDPSYDVLNPLETTPDRKGTRRHRLIQNLGGRALMLRAKLNGLRPGADKNRARMDYVGSAYRRILTYYRPPVYQGKAVIMTTPLPEGVASSQEWLGYALPNSTRTELLYDHYSLQRDPDALMAWTSTLSQILKECEEK